MPGYGFSDASSEGGMNPPKMAIYFSKLMEKLGYDKYLISGGDWGYFVGKHLSILDGEGKVMGFHTNMWPNFSAYNFGIIAIIKSLVYSIFPDYFMDEYDANITKNLLGNILDQYGYSHLQGTRPSTVGNAVGTNPLGLMTYIVEKYYAWSDTKNNDIESRHSKTDLLDNVMIYWLSHSFTSSCRTYYYFMHKDALKEPTFYIDVPTYWSRFKSEAFNGPKVFSHYYANLIGISDVIEEGGHFPLEEVPDLWLKEVYTFTKLILNKT